MLNTIVKQCPSLPINSKLLIFGGGFSGQHIARVARELGMQTMCSRQTNDKPGADFVFNSTTKEIPNPEILKETTHLISCIPPQENGEDPVMAHMKEAMKEMPLKWVGYLSTTGVYGDSQGQWVDESNTPKPQQNRSKRRLKCEKEWINSGLPVQILRLPGIYGPGRSALENIINRNCRLIDKPGQIFSRIHIDDIAGATMHLISLAEQGNKPQVVNIADNLPSTNIEVLRYAASLLNYKLPSVESFNKASKDMSPMALSFWQENRRVSNRLLCKKLSYNLIHPDFKSGLKECLLNFNSKE